MCLFSGKSRGKQQQRSREQGGVPHTATPITPQTGEKSVTLPGRAHSRGGNLTSSSSSESPSQQPRHSSGETIGVQGDLSPHKQISGDQVPSSLAPGSSNSHGYLAKQKAKGKGPSLTPQSEPVTTASQSSPFAPATSASLTPAAGKPQDSGSSTKTSFQRTTSSTKTSSQGATSSTKTSSQGTTSGTKTSSQGTNSGTKTSFQGTKSGTKTSSLTTSGTVINSQVTISGTKTSSGTKTGSQVSVSGTRSSSKTSQSSEKQSDVSRHGPQRKVNTSNHLLAAALNPVRQQVSMAIRSYHTVLWSSLPIQIELAGMVGKCPGDVPAFFKQSEYTLLEYPGGVPSESKSFVW